MSFQSTEIVSVKLWGQVVGAVVKSRVRGAYTFQYNDHQLSEINSLSPLHMPVRARPYQFPGLSTETWHGLPPAIADALPDRFGNSIINAELSRQGASADQVTWLDRLAYTGNRAMGALEFEPMTGPQETPPTAIDLSDLVIKARKAVAGTLGDDAESEAALQQILAVGTSAGGARAKAVVNINPVNGELTPGQVPVAGTESWLLKFDGVGADKQLGSGESFGRIEYAYSRMARAAGINVPQTRLHTENGRAHFMIQRFDRPGGVGKIHMQSLCAMAHLDFNTVGVHDYAQYQQTIRELKLGPAAQAEAFRRMAFNYAAMNCDDHTKNHSFLMDQNGHWSLAPAYDVTFSYGPNSEWVSQHLMGIGGKFLNVTRKEMMEFAEMHGVVGAKSIIDDVNDAVDSWASFANQAEVPDASRQEIDPHIGAIR